MTKIWQLWYFYERSYDNLNFIRIWSDQFDLTNFYEGFSWFKFNNLGLALGIVLKFYISVAKVLKLKARKFWRLITTFVEVTGAKLAGGSFCPQSWIRYCNRTVKLNVSYLVCCFSYDLLKMYIFKNYSILFKYFQISWHFKNLPFSR